VDELKKNGYWVVMGVLTLAALAFWGVAVASGKSGEIRKSTNRLGSQVRELENYSGIADEKVADPTEGLPVDSIVKYWEERKRALEAERDSILEKYKRRDVEFERLFSQNSKGEVEYTSWVTELRTRMKNDLRGAFKDLLEADEDAVFARAFPVKEPDAGDDARMVVAQKQFYVARAVAEAVKAVAPKNARIVEMTFAQRDADAKAAAKRVERVDATVELRFPATLVPALVSRLLQSPVVLEVREVRVETAPFTMPEFEPFKVFEEKPTGAAGAAAGPASVPLKGFAKDAYIATADSSNPLTKNGPPPLEEPPVSVKLGISALDFSFQDAAAAGKGARAKD
jgi:hypothetical protein